MRKVRCNAIWGILLVLMAASGCCTRRSAPPPGDGPSVLPPLSRAGAARAASLAAYARGLLDERARDYAAALTNFQTAARLAPENEELALRVALLLLQQRRADEAVQVMEEAYRLRPQSAKTLKWTILVNRAADRTNRVEELYRQLIRLDSAAPEPYLEFTALLLQQGRSKEALRLLEEGAKCVNEPLPLYRLLAGLYLDRGLRAESEAEKTQARKNALRVLEQARGRAPSDPAVLFQLADLYVAEGQIARGIECFEAIEQGFPNDPGLRRQLALNLFNKDRKGNGLLKELERHAPDHPRLYYYLAEIHQQKGDPDKALRDLDLAAQAFPEDPDPLLKKALILAEDLHKPETALTLLKEGLQKHPEEPRLLETLAYLHHDLKQYAEALTYFRRRNNQIVRTKETADTSVFCFNYALTAQAAGLPDEAAERLRQAMNQNPAYLEAYLQHAFSQTNEAAIRQSIEVLDKLGRQQPGEPAVYYYIALLNSYLKAYPAALTAFDTAERLLDDSPLKNNLLDARFYFWYGAAAERNGEFERAERLLERCLELDPEHAEAYNYLAYMWAEKGIRLDRALAYVQKALERNPSSGAFVDTLGWVYFRQGRYPQALEQLQKAAELTPNDPTILEHLGDILAQLGDEKQAEPYWRKSFLLDPGNEAVAEKLRRLHVDLDALRQEAELLKKQRDAEPPPSDESE